MQHAPRSPEIPALIVGAGPAGLVLACDLRRRGIACRIIDKAPSAFPGSRGKGLQPRSLEVLDDLGVIEAALRASGPFPSFRVYAGSKVVGERSLYAMLGLPPPAPDSAVPYPAPLVIPQFKTDEILSSRLAELGGRVERSSELVDFVQDEAGVTATVKTGRGDEQIRARYLVGTDGGGSFVRKKLAVGFAGETLDSERTLIGDVLIEGDLDREHCHMLTVDGNPGKRISLWPLPGSSLYQYIVTLDKADVPELSLPSLQKLLIERSGRTDIKLREIKWLSVYKVNVRMAARFQVGRVFLAGDAAHVHSSAGGQGLNTSMQDAYNLGWKLGAVLAGAPAALLDTYEEERLPVAAAVLGFTSELHQQGFKAVTGTKAEPRLDTQDIYQLRLNYRASSLSSDERPAGHGVSAGDRAPDAFWYDGAGNKKRLFDLFRGPHFTVLAFGGPHAELARAAARRFAAAVEVHTVLQPQEAGTAEAICDRDGDIRRSYQLQGRDQPLLIVRPDGYIGFAADKPTKEAIERYLGSVAAPA